MATKYLSLGKFYLIYATFIKWVGFPFLPLKGGNLKYFDPPELKWYRGLS